MKAHQFLESASAGATSSGSIASVSHGLGKVKKRSHDSLFDEISPDNGEYNDEAGMADNNLETLRRTVDGIDQVINSGDNLPEWCQEKIAVAKSMLVAVWDYMKSEEERGAGVTEHKKGVRAMKHTTKPRNFVAKNAAATTSGAGAHKDKKKAVKQGETKHKNKEMTYESKLFSALDQRLKK
jgi:hypothetical protein